MIKWIPEISMRKCIWSVFPKKMTENHIICKLLAGEEAGFLPSDRDICSANFAEDFVV